MNLIMQVRAGDSTAFDLLFDRHKAFIYNVCYRMMASREDAVDAVQSTFIQAFRELGKFRGESSLRTWLYRIAVNICTGQLRREKRRRLLSPEMEEHRIDERPRDRVWEAMLELPPDLRAILVLRYFQDLSSEEISQVMGCSDGAVRTKLHRAREAFKRKYKDVQS
ncbi:MAG: RNA polymerase sigma factor [Armatimonadota bacterium]